MGGGALSESMARRDNPLGNFGRWNRSNMLENSVMAGVGQFAGKARFDYEKGLPNEPDWMKEKKSAGKWVDIPDDSPMYIDSTTRATNIGSYQYISPTGNRSDTVTRPKARSYNTSTGEFSRDYASTKNNSDKSNASTALRAIKRGGLNTNEKDRYLRRIADYYGTDHKTFRKAVQDAKVDPYSPYWRYRNG